VRVAGRVVTGWAGHAALVEGSGDGGGAGPGEALGEDLPDVWGGGRVGVEAAQSSTHRAWAALGCGPASTRRYP
jgi:hypothetical protein